ncbi:MAG: hypothetical protein QXK29_05705 [Candidatus Bathyarchaeia archaeon]
MRVGDRCETPCKHKGVVVWVSKDGKTIAVKCLEAHRQVVRKWDKDVVRTFNPVYLIKLEEK